MRLISESFCRTSIFLMLFIQLMCSSCSRTKPSDSNIYRLARGGYSSKTNSLLIAIHSKLDEPLNGVFLTIYHEKDSALRIFYPIDPGPFDFAWLLKHDAFVVTHGDRISLFQNDTSIYGYRGEAIRCPLGMNYTYLALNPHGDLLAVNCYDLQSLSDSPKLGLYSFVTEQFEISEIGVDHHPLIWKNKNTVYVKKEDKVYEVVISDGELKISRTIPLEKGTESFYGLISNNPLIQKNKEVKLGDRILVEGNGAKKVIINKEYIFVSTHQALIVFDHKGQEIARKNTKKFVRFSSITEDSNTLYGTAENVLVRICVDGNKLLLESIRDLDKLTNVCD